MSDLDPANEETTKQLPAISDKDNPPTLGASSPRNGQLPETPNEHGEERHYSQRKRSGWWRNQAPIWIQALCAIGLVVITWFYTYYAKEQRNAMERTYAEIQKQTAQFTQQTNLLKQQMGGFMGAVVLFRMYQPNQGVIANVGHVMCPKVAFNVGIYKQRYPASKLTNKIAEAKPELTQVAPELPMPNNDPWMNPATFGVHMMDEVPRDQLDKMTPERPTLIIDGEMSYDTGFDRVITQHVCWVYVYLPGYKFANGASPGINAMVPCDQHKNTVDQYRQAKLAVGVIDK